MLINVNFIRFEKLYFFSKYIKLDDKNSSRARAITSKQKEYRSDICFLEERKTSYISILNKMISCLETKLLEREITEWRAITDRIFCPIKNNFVQGKNVIISTLNI